MVAVSASASAGAQDVARAIRVDAHAPVHAGTFHVASGRFIPAGVPLPPSSDATRGVGSGAVFRSNHYTGFFYDINDGTSVTDEGRLPSLSSPMSASPVSVTGTSNSYLITEIQLAYATNSAADGTAQLRIYDDYATCTDPALGDAPILDLTIIGLPPTVTPGALTPYTFDIDMSGFEFCMAADGDGEYSDGFSDRFGFTLEMSTTPGAQIGPIVGARPGSVAPIADGTVFQNPGANVGSGLGVVDQWWDLDPASGTTCFNWGGYDPIDNNPPFGSFWLVLESDLGADCVSCADDIDDDFEPNDTCATAAPLASNQFYTGLLVEQEDVDADFYRVTVSPNEAFIAFALFSAAEMDIDMFLFNSDCSVELDRSTTASNTERVEYFNCGETSIDLVLEVHGVDSTSNGDCGAYGLLLTSDVSCAADDALEDNDTCADAVSIPEGVTSGLVVSECDADYYEILLDPGEALDVGVVFDGSSVDIDLAVFLDDATCDATPLDSSLSTGSSEDVFALNSTGVTRTYVVRVDVFTTPTTPADQRCGGYVLEFVRSGSTEVGENFCSAELNTSGDGAHIFATGSDVIADSDLVLNCIFLPANQIGIFFNSTGQVFVPRPAGSDGNLCIGSFNMGRFNDDARNSGPFGLVSLDVDLDNFPQPDELIAVMPGDTFSFQYWTRDISPGGSNFSDALSITFQ
ncbi:MAG: hypothetical protein VX460_10485 [Planctomycetota bacterium]|nr:hypothetical protein [Planctomycetota bacterium]